MATDVIQHALTPLPLLIRILRHEPGGEKILKQWEDLIWLQIDPDQLPKWSLPPTPSQEEKKYYGDH